MKIKYVLALFFIFAFHIVSNCWVLSKSQVAYIYDEKCRIEDGVRMALSPESDRAFQLGVGGGQAHPHLFALVEAMSWKILGGVDEGKIWPMILITNSVFLLILLLSIYGIGSILYTPAVGVWAALLTSLFPLAFGHSRIAMLDYPLMCMVSLSFYLLLKTNNFTSRLFSCLFGIAFGLSELTKETAVLFIAFPLGYYFIQACSQGGKKRVISNLLFSISFFLVVAGMLYLPNGNLRAFDIYFAKSTMKTPHPVWHYFYFFHNLVGPIALAFSVPFLLSALMHFKKRKMILFFWFFIPLFLFSLSPNKTIRFLLPIAPAFALIISREVLESYLPRLFRAAALFFLITLAAIQYILYHNHFFEGFQKRESSRAGGLQFVRKDDLYQDEATALFDILKRETSGRGEPRRVLYLFNIGSMQGLLELKMAFAHRFFRFQSPVQINLSSGGANAKENGTRAILEADYILNLRGGQRFINQMAVYDGLEKVFERYKNIFVMMTSVPVHDGSYIDVYKRIKE